MPLNNHAILRLIIKNVDIRSVTVTRCILYRGVYEIFKYVEFEPCKEALYNGTIIVDDIHITYIFADILYLVLIHKIQNTVTPRIKLFNA